MTQILCTFTPVGKLHAFGVDGTLSDTSVDQNLAGTFHYQSASTALLGHVVEKACELPIQQVLSDVIWSPAGAGDAHWRKIPKADEVAVY